MGLDTGANLGTIHGIFQCVLGFSKSIFSGVSVEGISGQIVFIITEKINDVNTTAEQRRVWRY